MNSNRNQTPGGHKEGWASFPEQSQYKIFTNPWLKPLSLETREPRERESARDEKARLCSGTRKEHWERKRVREFLTH